MEHAGSCECQHTSPASPLATHQCAAELVIAEEGRVDAHPGAQLRGQRAAEVVEAKVDVDHAELAPRSRHRACDAAVVEPGICEGPHWCFRQGATNGVAAQLQVSKADQGLHPLVGYGASEV
jgi:hypothetical protein